MTTTRAHELFALHLTMLEAMQKTIQALDAIEPQNQDYDSDAGVIALEAFLKRRSKLQSIFLELKRETQQLTPQL